MNDTVFFQKWWLKIVRILFYLTQYTMQMKKKKEQLEGKH